MHHTIGGQVCFSFSIFSILPYVEWKNQTFDFEVDSASFM